MYSASHAGVVGWWNEKVPHLTVSKEIKRCGHIYIYICTKEHINCWWFTAEATVYILGTRFNERINAHISYFWSVQMIHPYLFIFVSSTQMICMQACTMIRFYFSPEEVRIFIQHFVLNSCRHFGSWDIILFSSGLLYHILPPSQKKNQPRITNLDKG